MIHRTRTAGAGVDLLTRYVYVVGELALIEDVNPLGLHRFATTRRSALDAVLEDFLAVPEPGVGDPWTAAPAISGPSLLDLRRESAQASLGESTLVADVLARPAGPDGPRVTRTVVSLFVLPGGTYVGKAPLNEQPCLLRRLDRPVGGWAAALLAGAALLGVAQPDGSSSGEPHPDPNTGDPNTGDPNTGEPNTGEPNTGEPNTGRTLSGGATDRAPCRRAPGHGPESVP